MFTGGVQARLCLLAVHNLSLLSSVFAKKQSALSSKYNWKKKENFIKLQEKRLKLPYIIEKNFDQLKEICTHFSVSKIYAFGSVLTPQFDDNQSDLDFVIEMKNMPPLDRGEKLIGLWEALEDLFAKKVDLITDQPIKNKYLRESINNSKQLIYDGES